MHSRKTLLITGSLAVLFHCGSSTPSTDGGTDAAADVATGPLGFQPSNVALADIQQLVASAKTENVAASCTFTTDATLPNQDCFQSSVVRAKQPDGSSVDLVVVSSLTIAAAATVRVTGLIPLVIVSLGDATISGTIDAHSATLNVGPGGGAEAQSNAIGVGGGGGLAGSATQAIGGGGGSFCGVGGEGGGQGQASVTYGSQDERPLVGGSSGGGGATASGAGGGAIQVVANGTLTVATGGAITVGGEGGPFGGVASDQNAGGGGSGGSILLEATNVVVAGTLASNGGGGGGDFNSPAGADGTANATAAVGGTAGTNGAAGGDGSASANINGANGNVSGTLNAGGGGGASGRLRINTSSGSAATTGATLSPAQSTACVSLGTLRALSAAP